MSLSDLAAMAARPVGMVVAVALPKIGGGQLAVELFEGMAELANRYETAVAGGDTNSWDGPLVVSVTAIGETTPAGPLKRSGAKQAIGFSSPASSVVACWVSIWISSRAVREALRLAELCPLHAGIDVSDGLSLDLSRSAESGCGAVIETGRLADRAGGGRDDPPGSRRPNAAGSRAIRRRRF